MGEVVRDQMITEEIRCCILASCKDIAKSHNLISVGAYGSRVSGYARKDSDYDVILVLEDFDEYVRYYYNQMNGNQFAVLAVDKKALEMDAEKGALGDFVVGRLLSPYLPILNPEYLRSIELETKRRFVIEDLEDLIIEYGELSRGLVVKLDYLVLCRMKKRATSYPPLKYSYVKMLSPELRERNMKAILEGYVEVLKGLVKLKMIKFDGENLIINNGYIDNILSFKIHRRVVNLMEFSRRAFHSYVTHGRAGRVKLDVVAKELASKIKRELRIALNGQDLEDPKNYLFLKTGESLISLSERRSIKDFISKLECNENVVISPLAGALNEVYLIRVGSERLVAKKFTDWFNIKWFALNVVAYGTKIFTLSGKARLSNEFGMNRLLDENGIPVPEIVHVNIQERLLVEQFIEGISTLDIIRDAVRTDSLASEYKKYVFETGRTMAKMHSLDVTLGDCKPENFIVSNGKVYVLDLEQSERKGDKVWDVAEFCYYSGHYGSILSGGLQQFIQSFIEGYAQEGDKKILRKASQLGYGRVFFVWTPMSIIQGIASILKAS
ncbi:MAG: Polbeta protein [Thermoproteota archaeon]|nr:Polbeta protein [Thermoproteota archaeon]